MADWRSVSLEHSNVATTAGLRFRFRDWRVDRPTILWWRIAALSPSCLGAQAILSGDRDLLPKNPTDLRCGIGLANCPPPATLHARDTSDHPAPSARRSAIASAVGALVARLTPTPRPRDADADIASVACGSRDDDGNAVTQA